jgi:hypothetical protein
MSSHNGDQTVAGDVRIVVCYGAFSPHGKGLEIVEADRTPGGKSDRRRWSAALAEFRGRCRAMARGHDRIWDISKLKKKWTGSTRQAAPGGRDVQMDHHPRGSEGSHTHTKISHPQRHPPRTGRPHPQ